MASYPNPNYTSAAQSTADSANQQLQLQTQANRPNQINPYQNTSWKFDPTTGQWTQNQSFAPGVQGAIDAQIAAQGGAYKAASGLLSGLPSGPLDFSGIPGMPDAGFGAVKDVQNAMTAQMAPDLLRRREQQTQRAAAMGLTTGSEAWNDIMDTLNRGENDASQKALLGATSEYNNIWNRSLQARQQGINELLTKRTQPLNEWQKLMSAGNINVPGLPNFVTAGRGQGADLLGAVSAEDARNLGLYNADRMAEANRLSGILGLGGQFAQSDMGSGLIGDALKWGGGALKDWLSGLFKG